MSAYGASPLLRVSPSNLPTMLEPIFSRRRCTSRILAGALLAMATPVGACYDYVPMRTSSSTLVGREVELALTDSGAVVQGRMIGAGSTAIDGTLLGDSTGHYLIAARQVRRRGADPAPWTGERLAIAHPLVSSISARQLAKRRTTLTVVGVVAGLIAARAAIRGLGGSNAGKGGVGVGQPPQ